MCEDHFIFHCDPINHFTHSYCKSLSFLIRVFSLSSSCSFSCSILSSSSLSPPWRFCCWDLPSSSSAKKSGLSHCCLEGRTTAWSSSLSPLSSLLEPKKILFLGLDRMTSTGLTTGVSGTMLGESRLRDPSGRTCVNVVCFRPLLLFLLHVSSSGVCVWSTLVPSPESLGWGLRQLEPSPVSLGWGLRQLVPSPVSLGCSVKFLFNSCLLLSIMGKGVGFPLCPTSIANRSVVFPPPEGCTELEREPSYWNAGVYQRVAQWRWKLHWNSPYD